MICLWIALACWADADERMVRRYADCMADPNTTLHQPWATLIAVGMKNVETRSWPAP